jgi:ABC-2 type transport system permease protein
MNGILHHIGLSLRLNARNRMAMIYGYLFPLIFLVAFWAIYRHDKVPLVLHMGQLLTVTALGGACFGLPTTMVSERERGVWRRYRLLPAPTWAILASTVVTRYVLLITAALLQIALAVAIGMPAPSHPLGLLVAFTFTSAAFIGLGMVIAMLANNVPAVQALGQCIFLPMLMIGGVAVQLSSLPDWALHASAFFPGRYAVKALQECVTGDGLAGVAFELLALLLIGAAGGVAAAKMFRWDARQRLSARGGKLWLAVALGMWVVVGLTAEVEGRIGVGPDAVDTADVGTAADYLSPLPSRPTAAAKAPPPEAPASPTPATGQAPPSPPAESAPSSSPAPASWRTVTRQDITDIAFERLPPDEGVVSPIARSDEELDPVVVAQVEDIRKALATWPPGKVADPVQRARNYLYVAAVPDVLQMEQVERVLPLLVFERLREDIPAKDLPGILYWIAMHPDEGDDSAIGQLELLGLPSVSGQTKTARGRVMLYAFKLLGRLTGDIAST